MPIPTEEWGALVPPVGFKWTNRPYVDGNYKEPGYVSLGAPERASPVSYRAAVKRLEAWAREKDVLVFQMTQGTALTVRGRPCVVPYKWALYTWLPWDSQEYGNEEAFFTSKGKCPHCRATFSCYDTECPACHKHLECYRCHKVRGAVRLKEVGKVWTDGQWHSGCTHCYVRCQHHEFEAGVANCDNLCGNGVVCKEHGVFFNCDSCHQEFEQSYRMERGEMVLCQNCAIHRCARCGSNNRLEPDDRGRELYCAACRKQRDELSDEKIDKTAIMQPAALVMPSLPSRPIRLMSIEQEFCQKPGQVKYAMATEMAAEIYGKGYCAQPNWVEYHHGVAAGFPCYMERDNTIDGGELVYTMLQMDKTEDAKKLHAVWNIMREAHHKGRIKQNLRCGMHIHIDLHGFNYSDCRTLQTVFGYLEDPLFRLAAAHYGEHRAIIYSREYARPIKKGKWVDNAEFVSKVLRESHNHDALSLQHYYKALRNCRCGAVEVGEVAKCKCNLGKCTGEWRIWNGTTNPVKLHAYMALAQSITAWCQGREVNPDDFPEMTLNHKADFTKEAGKLSRDKVMREWKPRLEWMFKNLTMTDQEWDSVLYCIKNSHLKNLGMPFINGLKGLPKVPDNRRLAAPAARPEAPGRRVRARPGLQFVDDYPDEIEEV